MAFTRTPPLVGAELASHLGDGAHSHAIRDMPAAQSCDTRQGSDVHNAAPSRRQHPVGRPLACAETAQHQIAPNLLHVFKRGLLWRSEDPLAGNVAKEVAPSEFLVETAKRIADLLGI